MSDRCYVDAEFEQLLAGDLADERAETICDHLALCQTCQLKLEQQAAEPWWWKQSRELVSQHEEITNSSVIAVSTSHTSIPIGQPANPSPNDATNFLQPPSHPELLGQLGKYQIESVVGQGGMGIVLKGFDSELNRTVAIKVLAPHLASHGPARQRFAREARAAAAVVHDHVTAIHGIETNGEIPYIVMPYIAGRSLQQHVKANGPHATIEIVRIAMQIAAGLSAAHEQGLVHRDIKPANIMLENNVGRVLITDFGLARAADDASITRSGLVAGTPHYMSPEQAHGTSIDHRSDLFSLGSVIYFMATGRSPFRADGTMAVLHAICNKEAHSIRDINANVPAELEVIVQKLLKKNPDERFASADSLRKLLADYLAHLQSPTKHPKPAELVSRPTRFHQMHGRKLLLAASCLAAICLAVLFATGIAMQSFWPTHDKSTRSHKLSTQSQASKPGIQNRVELLYGMASDAMAAFDVETEKLLHDMDRIESEWKTFDDDASSNWEQAYSSLQNEVNQLEQEWSSNP